MPLSSQPGSPAIPMWSAQVHLGIPSPGSSPLQLELLQPVVAMSAQAGRVGSEHATQEPPQPSSAPASLPEHEQGR